MAVQSPSASFKKVTGQHIESDPCVSEYKLAFLGRRDHSLDPLFSMRLGYLAYRDGRKSQAQCLSLKTDQPVLSSASSLKSNLPQLDRWSSRPQGNRETFTESLHSLNPAMKYPQIL